MYHIKNDREVEVVRDAKNRLTILKRSVVQKPPVAKQMNGNGLQHVSHPLNRVVEGLIRRR